MKVGKVGFCLSVAGERERERVRVCVFTHIEGLIKLGQTHKAHHTHKHTHIHTLDMALLFNHSQHDMKLFNTLAGWASFNWMDELNCLNLYCGYCRMSMFV